MDRKEADRLLEVATPAQARKIEALVEHGQLDRAAKALGINLRTLTRSMAAVRKKAARLGPQDGKVDEHPPHFGVDFTTTMYRTDPETGVMTEPVQWVRRSKDEQAALRAMEIAVETMAEKIPPARPARKPRKLLPENNANLYIVTDYHLGMKAFGEETRGDDWDMKIAEEMLLDFFSHGIRTSEDASVAVLDIMGDFLHWDGLDAVTPTSKHSLDADTRFDLLVETAIRVLRQVIEMLAQTHDEVYVYIVEGNHDIVSSIWLRRMFHAFYVDDPRITVDTDHDGYHAFEWGDVALFFHHGHKRKPTNIDKVFAAKFRPLFGRTKFAFAHLGHMHNNLKLESQLMMVEQHRTLAAPDAYASRGGWQSGREANIITYHKYCGQIDRRPMTPELLAELKRLDAA